jgi:putative ABC transport system permease protein
MSPDSTMDLAHIAGKKRSDTGGIARLSPEDRRQIGGEDARHRFNRRFPMYFRMVTGSILRRRSRMLIALLAVAIGATILSGLVTVYYDIPRQMGQEFRSYGANLILVPSGDESGLSAETIGEARDCIPAADVVGVAPYRYENGKINEQPFLVAGTDLNEVQRTSPYWFVSGEWPAADGAVLIGQEVADIIRLVPGDSFTLTGTDAAGESFSGDFRVSGVVQTGGDEEGFIFLSLADLNGLMGGEERIDVAECSVSASQEALSGIAAKIEENVAGVSARLVKRVTESEGAVLTKLEALVWLVTAVVLFLTMITVATTMMAVVAERRREIGLRKALGASDRSIAREFLGEGVMLGICGGLLGSGLGFAFAQLVSMQVFSRSISFQPLLIPLTVLVSAAITAVACLLPVRSATSVDPAVVLRGE